MTDDEKRELIKKKLLEAFKKYNYYPKMYLEKGLDAIIDKFGLMEFPLND